MILTSIIVGFSVLLCQKTKEITIIEDKLLALREDADNNKESLDSVKSDLEAVQSETEPEIDQEFQPQNDTPPRKLTGADFVPACAPACAALCDTPTETCAICIHRVCAGL